MRPQSEVLGVMYPVGGGDPIPLTKVEIVIGRRPGNDIRLDFENVSGKHCKLRFANGLWMARDLGSTNGTTVNGSVLASEQSVMPDEEVGFAGHLFTIDYEPAGPEAFLGPGARGACEQRAGEQRRQPVPQSIVHRFHSLFVPGEKFMRATPVRSC